MDLFTYLMAKNGNNTSVHGDLFSYLLGKGQSQTQTISGITIYIPNAKKLVSFMMTKESTQDGEPTPDNPVPVNVVEGYRNLFNKDSSNYFNTYIGSVSHAISTIESEKYRTIYIPIEGGKKYTITKKYGGSLALGTSIELPYEGLALNDYAAPSNKLKYTINTSSSANYLIVYIYSNIDYENNIPVDDVINTLLITEGTEEKPYIPYGNNYILYKQVGKNLFDKDDVEIGRLDPDGTVVYNPTLRTSNFINISNFTSFYISPRGSVRGKYYDENKNPLNTTSYNDLGTVDSTSPTIVNNIPANATFIRVSLSQEYLDSLYVIDGTEPLSTYEPYQESIIPIPLNNNIIAGIGDYKDELIVDKNGHCWLNKKTGKVVLDGSETWFNMGWALPKYAYRTAIDNIKILSDGEDNPVVMSNYYQSYKTNQLNLDLDVKYGIANRINQSQIIIRNDDCLSTTDFRNWLSTHNTEVYYALETPQLIDLNTTVDLKLFKGVNNISNSEDGYMTIEYK